MLTTRSDIAGADNVTGSLSAGAPGGTVKEERPPKVRRRSVPATIADPAARRAMRASPITSGSVPYSLDNRTRSDRPATLVWTIWRKVWSSNTVAGTGGVAALVTAVLQVPVQDAGRSVATAEPVRV